MRNQLLTLAVVAVVMLSGCVGIQDVGTPTGETPNADLPDIVPDSIPGVSNSTLTNTTALLEANEAQIVQTGAHSRITQTDSNRQTEALLTVGTDGTANLSTRRVASGNQLETVDYYSNKTGTYVRSQSNGETSYRIIDQEYRPLDRFSSSLETILAAGTFTVAPESINSTTVVLTADEFNTVDHGRFFSETRGLDGRLVLDQHGQIQSLTITGQSGDQLVSYNYELRQSTVDHASAPAWIAAVPPSAYLHPELSMTVENDSYLRIQHDGGDAVPRNASLAFSANNTNGTVSFDSAFESGETRYAYFSAGNGSLLLTTDKPLSNMTTPIDSPASITIMSSDGVRLHAVGMGWGSESSSGGAASEANSGDSRQE